MARNITCRTIARPSGPILSLSGQQLDRPFFHIHLPAFRQTDVREDVASLDHHHLVGMGHRF
jgi:hypothetical protein